MSAITTTAFRFVSINGTPFLEENSTLTPSISIWDTSFHRGDGVFEVMRLLPSGEIRGLDLHLKRLHTSATAVECPLPSPETLQEWLQQAATAASSSPFNIGEGAPGCLRLIATKGGGTTGIHNHVLPSVIISWATLPKWPDSFTLCPLLAPWHPAGAPGWETPIKWTSYGPNVVSTQKAKTRGFGDALLLSSLRLPNSLTPNLEDCHVLDGPNFAISWIQENTLYLPDTDALGLLPSITQDLVRDLAEDKLGMSVKRGIFSLKDVLEADEVYVSSTTRGIIPITRIGSHSFPSETPKVKQLQEILAKLNDGTLE
jgi:branched-subunit amino acid aminotransferase/4-amino-4-deoxychorismate lyase